MPSNKLAKLPPYIFAELDKKKRELRAKGIDLIDMSVGDPDIPTPQFIVDKLKEEAQDPKNHPYPPYNGTKNFRDACANYLLKTRGVKLDPDTEVLALIGSKEGLAHASMAYLNDGDIALIPSPGYPVYANSAILAGAIPYEVPLREENGFLPDFSEIPADVVKKSKILFLNYPNNPTSAIATLDFFKRAVEFGKKNNILICNDAAYIEITFDGSKAPSILEAEGAKDVAVEFHSLSKTYNMTGWRLGFVAGNAAAIAALAKFKTIIDSSATVFVQEAGAYALNQEPQCPKEVLKIFEDRKILLTKALESAGLQVYKSPATHYLWVKNPKGVGSADFATKILEKAGVAVTPGNGFGTFGEGYIRFSVTVSTERIKEAIARIRKI